MSPYKVARLIVIVFLVVKACARTFYYPILILTPVGRTMNTHQLISVQRDQLDPIYSLCLFFNIWTYCPVIVDDYMLDILTDIDSENARKRSLGQFQQSNKYQERTKIKTKQLGSEGQVLRGRLNMNTNPLNFPIPRRFNQNSLNLRLQNENLPQETYHRVIPTSNKTPHPEINHLRAIITGKQENDSAEKHANIGIMPVGSDNGGVVTTGFKDSTSTNNLKIIPADEVLVLSRKDNSESLFIPSTAKGVHLLSTKGQSDPSLIPTYETTTQVSLICKTESKSSTIPTQETRKGMFLPRSDDKNETTYISTYDTTSEVPLNTTNGRNQSSFIPTYETISEVSLLENDKSESFSSPKSEINHNKFVRSLKQFERKFYEATFNKLTSISPLERRENGISFVQSGLFLHMLLTALSPELGPGAREEVEKCLHFSVPHLDKIKMIKQMLSELPVSNDALKFRWSSRLVLGATNVSQEFKAEVAPALHLHLDHINGTETPEVLTKNLNHMVELDSGGAMRDTFVEDELSEGARAVLLNTLYVRGRWRSAPTLLNGTREFRDHEAAPKRSTRMIRINDIMMYADLNEWDAEALEIKYATPGLTLLMLIPRGRSLRSLAERVSAAGVCDAIARLRPLRVAASLPLYTLRMTLLLPTKLQAMGVSQLVNVTDMNAGELRLSHAVQRVMFWSEAGRNAFKDDGIEWERQPELELMVDRPYVFFVRWHNVTLLNGNFVL